MVIHKSNRDNHSRFLLIKREFKMTQLIRKCLKRKSLSAYLCVCVCVCVCVIAAHSAVKVFRVLANESKRTLFLHEGRKTGA